MKKHYSPPEFHIVELRLRDVILLSDEWETPLLGFNPDSNADSYQDINGELLPE